MQKRLKLIYASILACLWCLTSQAAFAQTTQAQSDAVQISAEDVSAWLDGYVPYAMRHAHIAGAVVVVVDRDGIVFEQGYGFADIDAGTPVSATQTLFCPGSISKLFTFTAVMQQVEQGKLDLDADINGYLDFEIPPFEGEPITLRHVLTYTPGFEETLRYLFVADPMPLEDYIKQSLPTCVFAPGSTPAYSNYASALAGYIVERVSGMPFNAYIDAHIFSPLGMETATFAQPLPTELAGHMSQRYQSAQLAPRGFEYIAAAPAGALSASGADIGAFMVAHLNAGQGVLQPETAAMMQDHIAPGIAGLNRMALGFYEKRLNGRRGIGHGGDTQGFHSDLTIFPDEGVGIYIALNSSGKGGKNFAIRQLLVEEFANRYLPDQNPEDIVPGVDPVTARDHVALVSGTYKSSRGSFTNFLSFAGFLGQTPVGAHPDGSLSFPMLDMIGMGPFDWVEVAPFVWQDRYSSHTIAAEVVDGEVIRLSTDILSPVVVFLPVSGAEDAQTMLPLLILAMMINLSQAVLWPARWAVRRKFGAALALRGPQRLAYRLTGVFAWGVVIAVVGWAYYLLAASGDATLLGGPLDGWLNGLRIVTQIAAVGLGLAACVHFVMAFKTERSWLAHIGRLLLLLSAGLIVWIVFAHHLYGLGLTF